MRTAARHLRKGVAAAMLDHLIDEAGRRAYRRLSLETGSMDGFEPARRLYTRFGFDPCEPFADYVDDPNSVFMTKHL
jgi:putative acetyltransferase